MSTKRGIKIRNIQVESPYSRESLQQDLFLLSQQTIPIDYQSQNAINILWRELPMSPRSSNCEKYADINFDVQSNIFCCHKVKLMTFIFLYSMTRSILTWPYTWKINAIKHLFRPCFGQEVNIFEHWLTITSMKDLGMLKQLEPPYQSTM